MFLEKLNRHLNSTYTIRPVHGHELEQTLRERGTGRPGVLEFMGSQTVGHNLVTGQQQQEETNFHNSKI